MLASSRVIVDEKLVKDVEVGAPREKANPVSSSLFVEVGG